VDAIAAREAEMRHPFTGAEIVSVGELRELLAKHPFPDDAPLGVLFTTEQGKPVPGQPLRFPSRISVAPGTGLPDMLVISLPPAPQAN
jgi:hypothetical protein